MLCGSREQKRILARIGGMVTDFGRLLARVIVGDALARKFESRRDHLGNETACIFANWHVAAQRCRTRAGMIETLRELHHGRVPAFAHVVENLRHTVTNFARKRVPATGIKRRKRAARRPRQRRSCPNGAVEPFEQRGDLVVFRAKAHWIYDKACGARRDLVDDDHVVFAQRIARRHEIDDQVG